MRDRTRLRRSVFALPLLGICFVAPGCGGDSVQPPVEPAMPREESPAWAAMYVRGSEKALAAAGVARKGAMLVVSASW